MAQVSFNPTYNNVNSKQEISTWIPYSSSTGILRASEEWNGPSFDSDIAGVELESGALSVLTAEKMASAMIWSDGQNVLDPAILAALPKGVKAVSVEQFGTSSWSVTGRILCETRGGLIAPKFFLKLVEGPEAAARVEGEYEAMKALRSTLRSRAAKPIGWGKTTTTKKSIHFYVCEFVDIIDGPPDAENLGMLAADLHRRTFSPTGKYGFHVPTFDGVVRQHVEWDDDWVRYFSKFFEGIYKVESKANGPMREYDRAIARTISHVIPRLLGALTSEGRSIRPCLIHGDLWEANIGTTRGSGELCVFDSAAIYAHHELDVGTWTCEHHRLLPKAYLREYRARYPPSEPVEESDDRVKLYGMKEMMVKAFLKPSIAVQFRKRMIELLNMLNDKYTPYAAGEGVFEPSEVSTPINGVTADGLSLEGLRIKRYRG